MGWDLIVVGAGFGGLTAALRASELGLKTVIVERGADEDYLCNSRISGGHVTVCMSDPAGLAAPIADKIVSMTQGSVDPAAALAFAQGAKPMIEWLRAHGLRFIRIGPDPARQWVMAPPRGGQAGLNWKGMGPDVALRQLAQDFLKAGGTILYAHRAVGLLKENNRCSGVETECADGPKQLRAKAVVLADGGFQGDLAAVGRFISRSPSKLKQRNAGSATGDALRMAMSAGAKVVGTDRFYGHPLSRDAFTNDQLWPHPYLDPMTVAGVVVGADGRRFVDEGVGPVHLSNVIASRDDPLDSFVVFDQRVWTGPAADISAPPSPNPTLVNRGATIYVADTIEDLASQSGLPAAELVDTITRFNLALEQGTPGGLTPPRTTDRFKPWPVLTAPFYAIPMCAGLTYTMGGPLVDDQARVLDVDEQPIPGLFAVGSASGGLEGGPSSAYLGGLAKAFIQGLNAAACIASEQTSSSTEARVSA